jgi:hypothetical protein
LSVGARCRPLASSSVVLRRRPSFSVVVVFRAPCVVGVGGGWVGVEWCVWFLVGLVSLGWLGLGWVLGWAGLGWIGWVGLGWIGLLGWVDWVLLDWVVDWVGSD